MPPERSAGDVGATQVNARRAVEVAVYPARVGRAGDGRPCSPARAYRLPDDPGRAAAAARTADSRRTVSPAPVLPPAPALPAAPRPAPAVSGFTRAAVAGDAVPARGPKHLAPAPWYRRLPLALLHRLRGGRTGAWRGP